MNAHKKSSICREKKQILSFNIGQRHNLPLVKHSQGDTTNLQMKVSYLEVGSLFAPNVIDSSCGLAIDSMDVEDCDDFDNDPTLYSAEIQSSRQSTEYFINSYYEAFHKLDDKDDDTALKEALYTIADEHVGYLSSVRELAP
jgi:hypothetical protein